MHMQRETGMVARMRRRERRASSRAQQPGPSGSARIIIEFNRYRGLMSSASVMKGLKPFEDTIYIDNVPVIEYKSGTDGSSYSIR